MKRLYINILLLILVVPSSFAQTSDSREYEVKAVFLFNFTQFVEWPADAFPEPGAPFIIGILGKDPFENYLEQTVTGEKVNGHPLVIRHYNDIEEIKICHILFINQAEINTPGASLVNLKGKPILTVSDANDFIQQGGMIGFITKDNNIRIQINPGTAKEANLTISSKLLRIAEVVSQK